MVIRPKRSLVLVALSLPPVLAVLAWLTGYLYWQARIGRAIEDLKCTPDRYTTLLFHADPELQRIGSRGVPRLLGELEEAILNGDERLAFALTCGLTDLLNGAQEVNGKAAAASGSYEITRPAMSMEEIRASYKEWTEGWPEMRGWYPPWWQWWDGRTRGW